MTFCKAVLAGLQYCGALFNLGKAFGMQGKADRAAEAYGQAIEVHIHCHCLYIMEVRMYSSNDLVTNVC